MPVKLQNGVEDIINQMIDTTVKEFEKGNKDTAEWYYNEVIDAYYSLYKMGVEMTPIATRIQEEIYNPYMNGHGNKDKGVK